MKKFRWTLRFRLAVWNVAVVLITSLVILAGLRQGVEWAILHEMDQILLEDAQAMSMALQELGNQDFEKLTDEISRTVYSHRRHGWFAQLLDEQGQTLWKSQNSPDFPSLNSIAKSAAPVTRKDHRVLTYPVKANSSRVHSICLGVHLEFLRKDMAILDRLSLATVLMLLLAAPVLGYYLAARAAKTVGDIIQTANKLRPTHLEERLPVTGSDDELDQLSITINRLLDRIADYLQQRRDFLADSAHELRSPLAAIRSSAEVALSRERNVEEYQSLLEDIIEQGAALEIIVNQLLLISESEAEHLTHDVQTVAFDQLVRRSAEMFEGVAELQGTIIETRISSPVSVRGNPQLLRQLANNLIDNSIKYTQAGGKIQIELSLQTALLDGESVTVARLVVQDTGIGIPVEDLPRVFDRFYRADKSRPRQNNATGLGLSICRAVVTAHHGTISCESAPGRGSRFCVEIPAVAEESSGSV